MHVQCKDSPFTKVREWSQIAYLRSGAMETPLSGASTNSVAKHVAAPDTTRGPEGTCSPESTDWGADDEVLEEWRLKHALGACRENIQVTICPLTSIRVLNLFCGSTKIPLPVPTAPGPWPRTVMHLTIKIVQHVYPHGEVHTGHHPSVERWELLF